VASKYNSPEAVAHILKAGADVNARNESGNCAAHIASKANRPEILQVLLDFKADFTAANELGDTPLHTAASAPSVKGRNAALSFLMQRQDISPTLLTVLNKKGKTPLDVAARDKGNLVLMGRQGVEVVEEEEEEVVVKTEKVEIDAIQKDGADEPATEPTPAS